MFQHDYIIDHRNVNWPTVLREWSWLVPPAFTVWIIVLGDGTVHMLDVGSGTLTKVAESRDDFAKKTGRGRQCESVAHDPPGRPDVPVGSVVAAERRAG